MQDVNILKQSKSSGGPMGAGVGGNWDAVRRLSEEWGALQIVVAVSKCKRTLYSPPQNHREQERMSQSVCHSSLEPN